MRSLLVLIFVALSIQANATDTLPYDVSVGECDYQSYVVASYSPFRLQQYEWTRINCKRGLRYPDTTGSGVDDWNGGNVQAILDPYLPNEFQFSSVPENFKIRIVHNVPRLTEYSASEAGPWTALPQEAFIVLPDECYHSFRPDIRQMTACTFYEVVIPGNGTDSVFVKSRHLQRVVGTTDAVTWYGSVPPLPDPEPVPTYQDGPDEPVYDHPHSSHH